MDDTTRFLQLQGCQPQPVHFMESDYLLGYRVDTQSFKLVYRHEQTRLVLCEFSATSEDGQAVLALRVWLRQLLMAVPGIKTVEAMILAAPGQAMPVQRMRLRLCEIMLAAGAYPVRIDGNVWLRFDR